MCDGRIGPERIDVELTKAFNASDKEKSREKILQLLNKDDSCNCEKCREGGRKIQIEDITLGAGFFEKKPPALGGEIFSTPAPKYDMVTQKDTGSWMEPPGFRVTDNCCNCRFSLLVNMLQRNCAKYLKKGVQPWNICNGYDRDPRKEK